MQVAQSLNSKKRALADIDEVLETASNQLTTDLYPWTPKPVLEPVTQRLPAPLKALYRSLLTVRDEEKIEVILRQPQTTSKKRAKRLRAAEQQVVVCAATELPALVFGQAVLMVLKCCVGLVVTRMNVGHVQSFKQSIVQETKQAIDRWTK